MKNLALRMIQTGQKGFTMIELLAALAITGLIGTGAAISISQVLSVNANSVAHMTSVKQVENALHWLSRDAQMAQTVSPQGGTGFPLTLIWRDWENSVNQVTYSLENGSLVRTALDEMIVARQINPDPALTNCSFSDRLLTIKLTATVNSYSRPASETRICTIIPRPGS